MQTTRVFTNGNSQAVRLPADFRLDVDEVSIERRGDVILLRPLRNHWQRCFTAIDALEVDFPERPEQPELETPPDFGV